MSARSNPYVAKAVKLDYYRLAGLKDVLWGTSFVLGEHHVVMSARDWRRVERAGAVISGASSLAATPQSA